MTAQASPSGDSKIRLLYLITDLRLGGAQTVLTPILQRLDAQRFRPQVACLFGGDLPVARQLRAQGVEVIDLGMTSAWRLDALWRLYRLLRKERVDILHASLFHANLAARLVGRLAGVPVIVTWRQNISLGGAWRERINRLTARLDDCTVAASEVTRQAELKNSGAPGSKVVVIYNCIDAEKYALADESVRRQTRGELGIPPDAFLIGFIGRLHPQKGLPLLLQAFARARGHMPEARLLLVGEGELGDELNGLAQSLGIADATLFTGARTDVPQLLAALDAFVLPSLWEGLPLAVLEAMAAGLPVVATAVGGTPEAILDGESGLLAPPNDPDALAEAILRLYRDPGLRARLGKAARQRVGQVFSAEQSVQKLTALYEGLLMQKAARFRNLVFQAKRSFARNQVSEDRIRVLHPITRLIVGGAQENTMLTTALLDKARFQAEVLCGPQTGSEGSLIEETRARGVSLTILPELLRQVSPLNDLRALWKMALLMRRGGYTIVHTHSSKAGILGRLAARLAGVPIIVHTVHGWSFHNYMSPAVRMAYILIERLCAAFSDILIVVARRDIEKGLQAGIGRREQYHLIRSAIPLDEFDPTQVDRADVRQELGLSPEAVVVGNVGRFSAQKNPLDWVRAAGIIARAHPETRFLLVGDGPLRPQVEALLRQEGIAERTLLTGLRRDAARMFAAMDIFLLTSLWEGLPRVIPQAMAMGLPVVANQADGTLEAIQPGETGYLCQPGDVTALAVHCIHLIEHPEERRRMGDKGRAFAMGEFDLSRMIEQIEGLYEGLVRG